MKQIELYKKYRPRTLEALLGQDQAVASIRRLIDTDRIPHAILLTGPSGVGKTTIARILKDHLKCSNQDFIEKNCADFRSVDDIREIRRHLNLPPLNGPCRIWLIDECHKLTNDAQNAFLKMLEDTPSHAYFMLATTDEQKLIETIHTRCSQIKLKGMSPDNIRKVIMRVVNKEGMKVSESVVDEIIEAAQGSARKALVILEQVGYLEKEEEQMEAIQATTFNKDTAIQLARQLVNPKIQWMEVASTLKKLKDQDPEGIRYLVLGYARSCMLGGGAIAERSFHIICHFSEHFFNSKQAGLAAACWRVVHRH